LLQPLHLFALQWDSGNTWATMQPTARGQFNWTVMDRDAAQARKRNQKILFTLGQSPQWCAAVYLDIQRAEWPGSA
jgi:hypothetical protein